MAGSTRKSVSRKAATKSKAVTKPTVETRTARAGTMLKRAAGAAGRLTRKAGATAKKAMKQLKGSRTAKIAAAVAGAVVVMGLAARKKPRKRRW